MEYECTKKSTLSFHQKVILCIEYDDIKKLDVHKGKDPSVEIYHTQQYKDGVDDEGNDILQHYSITITFTGDMERQQFIDRIWDLHVESDNEEESEFENEEDQMGDDDDSDSSDNNGEIESDEEPAHAQIYD